MAQYEGSILVTGATGSTGAALLRSLRSRGVAARAMVRRPTDGLDPAETVVADFTDAASLAPALAGIDRAYLVTPSSELAAEQQIRFADAAHAAGVRQLVVLSQLAADETSPVRFLRWHAEVERYVRELGIGHTFLRPNLFFQGLLVFADLIATTGRFYAPIGTAAVSAVDVRDIADVAATVLTETGHLGRTYDVTGPEAITHERMAAALSAAVGRDVTFVDAPPEAFAANLAGALPAWQAEGVLEDYAHYRRGEAQAVSRTVAELTGHPARGVEAFARDHTAAFQPE